MYLYDRKMVTNTNLKYAESSLNYYVIIIVQKLLWVTRDREAVE